MMARPNFHHSAEYWRARAEEAAARAEAMRDPDARRSMMAIAKMYSQMALRVETRNAERSIAERDRAPR